MISTTYLISPADECEAIPALVPVVKIDHPAYGSQVHEVDVFVRLALASTALQSPSLATTGIVRARPGGGDAGLPQAQSRGAPHAGEASSATAIGATSVRPAAVLVMTALLGDLEHVVEEEEGEVGALSGQLVGPPELDHVRLAQEISVGRDEVRRAVLNVLEYSEDISKTVGLPLVLVDVLQHFFDLPERGLEGGRVGVLPLLAGVLEQVVEQQADAAQPLHGSDQQLGERLAPALPAALAHFEKGVEARVGLVALLQRPLRVFEEVDEGRVGPHEVLCVSQKHRADAALGLLPVSHEGAELCQHLGVHVEDGRDVAKDDLDLRLVQQLHLGIVGRLLEGIPEHFQDGVQDAHVVLLGLQQLCKHLLSRGKWLLLRRLLWRGRRGTLEF